MSVKSAERVLEIFELLTDFPNGLTIKEISDHLVMPQSSAFNIVKTLCNRAYLIQSSDKRYKLGAKLIHIGQSAMDSLDLAEVGNPYLIQLMNEVKETVFMAILSEEEKELVYIAKIDNNRSIRTTAQLGFRKPLYCTGLGKAFLAFMPEEKKIRILDQTKFLPVTDKTITDRGLLEKQLESFRQLGHSIDDEENEEGLFCLAAPVYGARNELVAAISVAGPKERMLNRKDAIGTQLKTMATEISRGLGNSGT